MYIHIYCEITSKSTSAFPPNSWKKSSYVNAWITQLIKTKYAHSPESFSPSTETTYSAYGMCISLNKPALSFLGFSAPCWSLPLCSGPTFHEHSSPRPRHLRQPGTAWLTLLCLPLKFFPAGSQEPLLGDLSQDFPGTWSFSVPPFFCNSISWHLIVEENVANWEHCILKRKELSV